MLIIEFLSWQKTPGLSLEHLIKQGSEDRSNLFSIKPVSLIPEPFTAHFATMQLLVSLTLVYRF